MEDEPWFFELLSEAEKEASAKGDIQVTIEGAVNVHSMSDYVVSCSYGDIVLIICMLHDYVKMLDEMRAENINYQAYYRGKYLKMADRLAEQIGYDYEKKLEECLRKNYAEETDSDIGGDAVELSMKYGRRARKEGGGTNVQGDVNRDQESVG